MENKKLIMWLNNIEEQEFFLSYLKPEHTVLEWGSGMSTFAIADRVNRVISIEHNKDWFESQKNKLPKNVDYYMIPSNKDPSPAYDDGTLEDFKDYVTFPESLNMTFDIIFIDGRARVECFNVASNLLNKDGYIFIHDYRHPTEKYRRREYEDIEHHWSVKSFNGIFAMYKFKLK